MKSWISRSRGVLVLLVFMLALTPMSVLADAKESNKLTYVALGDSLAAGMLDDRGTGEGYVGKIVGELESRGYEVTLTNEGSSGATSEEVKNQLENVADADIITLTAGVNDLLFPELVRLAEIDDPRYFGGAEGIALIKKDAMADTNEAIGKAIERTNDATAAIKTVADEIAELRKTILEKRTALEELLSKEIVAEILSIGEGLSLQINGHSDVPESYPGAMHFVNDATEDLAVAQTNFNKNDELADAFENLRTANERFDQGAKLADGLKDILGENFQSYVVPLVNAINTADTAAEHAASSVGDAMNAFDSYVDQEAEIDEKAKLALTIMQGLGAASGKIPMVGSNIGEILTKLRTANPDADIYVMGYYNAFPYVEPAMQGTILAILDNLNAVIQGAADAAGATYVPTIEAINKSHLPVPTEIHPNDAGYRAIADQFIASTSFGNNYPVIEEDTGRSEPVLVPLDKETEVFSGETLLIGTPPSALIQLPDDLPDGTTILVEKADQVILEKAENLAQAGAAYHFTLNIPDENYDGQFTLLMKYDGNADVNDADIYYYDETDGVWKAQGGTLTELLGLQGFVIHTNHFSSYGVFEKVKDGTDAGEEAKCDSEDCEDEDDGGIAEADNDEPKVSGKTVESGGGKLPATATNHYNLMGIGLLMIFAGFGVWFYQRRPFF